MTCLGCGSPIPAGSRRRWCTTECRTTLRSEGTRVCSQCKTEKPLTDFRVAKTKTDGRERACRECARDGERERARARYYTPERQAWLREYKLKNPEKYRQAKEPHACDLCGDDGVPASRKYCEDCRTLPNKIVVANCQHCGELFVRKGQARYCGDDCRREWKLEHDRSYRRKRAADQGPAPRVFYCGTCLECDEPFVHVAYEKSTPSKYCCERHMKRARRRRDKKARSKRIRKGVAVEQIGHVTIARRDGWKCHICKRKVTRENWSIDHLVPLSEGGSHTKDNVRLAHFLCNSVRGTSGDVQLILVG